MLIDVDEEIIDGAAGFIAVFDPVRQLRTRFLDLKVGRQFILQTCIIFKREVFSIVFDEKVERIENADFGDQIDFDAERFDLFRKGYPREKIAERVLLPIDKMFRRRHIQAI